MSYRQCKNSNPSSIRTILYYILFRRSQEERCFLLSRYKQKIKIKQNKTRQTRRKNTRNNGRNCVEVNHSACGLSQHLWSIVIFEEDAPTPLCIPRYLDQILQRVYVYIYIYEYTRTYTARHKPFSVLRNELFISNLIITR